MAAEIARVCGPAEAAGYRRFVDVRLAALPAGDARLHRPQHRLAARPAAAVAGPARGDRRLPPAGAEGRRSTCTDPRTQRVFSFQAMYAGLSPYDALAIYAVIALHGLGGRRVLPARRHARGAAGAGRRGREARRRASGTATTVTRVETARRPGRGGAHRGRRAGRRATWWCSTPTCRSRTATCWAASRVRAAADVLAVVLPAARRVDRGVPGERAPHHLTSGAPGGEVFDEILGGRLMSDPSFLVTNPTRVRPVAGAGRPAIYYVLFPTPNLDAPHRLAARPAPRYRDEVVRDAGGARLRRLRRRHRGRRT